MPARFTQYITVFLIAAAVSYFFTPLVARIARVLNILDHPAKNKIHKKPVPRLGGVAVFIAYFCALLITGNLNSSVGIIIFSAAAVLFLGVLDDIFRVPAVVKLVYIFILTFMLAKQGLVVKIFGEDFFYPNMLVTLLWIVGVTSAFNAVDNMDGLAGGLGAIAALAFFTIALRTGQWGWAALAMALAGALLGFLRYNFSPARIFLGDSGSLFLGFTLAVLGVKGEWSVNAAKAALIPILVLGVPIFDLAYIVIRRWREGTAKGVINAVTFCAKDHLSHRLVSLGLRQKTTVLFIYLLAVCISIAAVVLQNAPRWEAALLLLQFILIFFIIMLLINITKRIKA